MANLFGETPGAIRQAMMNEQLNRARVIGNLGPGGHGALGGLMAGQGIVGLLGAQEDPRLQQAQALQSIEQQIEQEGLEPGTRQFTQRVSQLVGSRLGLQAQTQAMQMALELEEQRGRVDALRNGPAAQEAQTLQRAQALSNARRARGLPEDPETTLIISTDPKLWADRMKELRKEKELPDSVQAYLYGKDNPGFFERQDARARAGAGRTSVEVNSFDVPTGFMKTDAGVVPIPGGPKDPTTLSPSEAAAAREKAGAMDGGITAVDALIQTLEGAGPPILPGQEKSIANYLRGEMIAAVAAMRNLGVLQPGELEFLKEQIPEVSGLVAALKQGIDPAALTAPLKLFRQRATEARRRLRLPESEQAPASDKPVSEMTDEELERLAR